MSEHNDRPAVVIIGAGIAGCSLAAELGEHARVTVIEAEPYPGVHSTGRSAALFTTGYGPPSVRALSRASEDFLKTPGNFSEVDLLRWRGVLFVGREDQRSSISALHRKLAADGCASRVDAAVAREHFPLLRSGYAAEAIWYPGAWDIDVNALTRGYLRRVKRHAGELLTGRCVTGLSRDGSGWAVETETGAVRCDFVVNAAGAWAVEIAELAGAAPVEIVPKKRTAATIKVPDGTDIGAHCALIDVDEEFYAKPEAGHLLISPADETPVTPADVYADDLDVAIAVDRVEKALDINIQRIESNWAGLRSFAPDGCPVLGFDPHVDGFFWCAGQGGYGIQSAPAIARLCAAQLLGKAVPDDILAQGLELSEIDVARYGRPS